MISSFEKDKLNKLLKDLHTAVGIRISVFDENFQLITEYPTEMPDFCKLIRSSKLGESACHACNNEACKRAKDSREAHVYTCHAGLTEAITPISLGGGVIGYAIFAHMMPSENYDEAVDELCRRASKYGCKEDDARAEASKIKKFSNEQIIASVRILDAIASYLQITNLATWKNEDISSQIDLFIENNITEKLDSNMICKHFYISRTKLYQISMQSFGMGIAQYVTYKRIQKAKKLFIEKGGETTVTVIARQVGVDDYNYFCKLFKKSEGISPGRYMMSLRK